MNHKIYSEEYVKELFDRMSGSYERMNYITSFGFSIRWRIQFLKPLKKREEKNEIIDLMTGMGETWSAIKRSFPNSSITGLDFSEGMLKYAKQRNLTRYNNKINILKQDVLKNDLPSNHYDLVVCAFGLKTFDFDQLNILATEIKRILKVGGQFSFIEVSRPNNNILRFFYAFYLGKIIPVLGKLLLGNPEEYKMLWCYTNTFGNAKKAAEIFTNVGLATKFNAYFLGCATGFYGEKTSE